MRIRSWRATAVALLAMSACAIPAYAQGPSAGSANQSKSQQTQSNQATSNQSQSDANGASKNSASQAGNTQGNSNQGAREGKNSPGQTNGSNSSQQSRTTQSGRQDQQSKTNLQGQAGRNTNIRSNQNSQRSGADNGDARRNGGERRHEMRGPDIGIWFNRGNRDGLVISDVASRGAIAKLGFREGDRIISVNGRRVSREPEFIEYLLARDANRVEVVVFRNGRNESIYVEPAVLTEEYEYTEVEPLEQFGVVLDDRYDDRIVIWKVVPRSPAYYAGLRAGDVITTVSGRPYKARTEFEKAVREMKSGEVNVQVRRGERTRDLSVDVSQAQRSDQSAGSDRSDIRNEGASERGSNRTEKRKSNQSTQGNADRSERGDKDHAESGESNRSKQGNVEGSERRENDQTSDQREENRAPSSNGADDESRDKR